MKRPLLLVALFYVCGILLSRHLSLSPFLPLATGLALTILALAWGRVRLVLLYVVCVLAGWANYGLKTAVLSPYDPRRILPAAQVIASVRGTLRDTPTGQTFELEKRESHLTSAQIALTAIRLKNGPWLPAEGIIAVTSTAALPTNFFGGQLVEVAGVASPPNLPAAEGLFDYRSYLADKGIYYSLKANRLDDWKILQSPAHPPLTDRFRAWARRALALGMPVEDDALRLEWALTLGWKQALTEDLSEPFVRAATYHIFAVDGLRMAIITGIFFTLLRALRVPRPVCAMLLIPMIWYYTALTGWPASAVRANVMLTVVLAGWILKRPSDTVNSLFAAALIILLWEPRQLFQAGFQLSFVVVYYIILIDSVLREWWRRLLAADPLLPDRERPRWRITLQAIAQYPLELGVSSFTAWIASVPLVAYYFHLASPVSTPANIIAVPLCGLVLICNLSSLLLAAWFPAAAVLFNNAGWFCMKLILWTSQWFADWPRAYFYVSRPELLTTVFYYAVLFAIATGWFLRPRLRVWKISAFAFLLCAWTVHHLWEANVTRLTFIPMNGGMATFFEPPGSKNDLLVDCGNSNSVRFITKQFLRAQGVNELPAFALTHGDLRHIGGAELVMDLFHVPKLCVTPIPERSPVYRQIIKHLSATPEKLEYVSRSNSLGAWTILHPESNDHFPQADDNAIVLDATFEGCRVLLLSDLGRPGQEALMNRTPNLRADIVVTGLPVQNEALCDALLDVMQPRVIVVVDSEDPSAEQAKPALHERLARRKIPVIYTRFAGATTIEWRDKAWRLRTISGIRLSSEKLTEVPDPVLDELKAREQ